METMEVMHRRQSCRDYLPGQISEEALNTLLLAANAAPVGMGKYQNMHLTVVQNSTLLTKLNVRAADFMGDPTLRPTYGAPTVIFVSAAEGDPDDVRYCNAACIVENMHLAATDLGLGSVYLLGCIRALQKAPELQRELGIPEGFTPMSALAVGMANRQMPRRELTAERIACKRMP